MAKIAVAANGPVGSRLVVEVSATYLATTTSAANGKLIKA
jgi:hypothetical protein